MNISPCLRFLIVPLFLLGALAACAAPEPTEAQNRLKAYGQSMRVAGARLKVCLGMTYIDPAYVAVASHFAMPSDNATPEQLADTTKPTDEDVANLRKYSAMQGKCRSAFVSEVETFSPIDAAAFKKSSADLNAILMDLIERKISWGESAQRRKAWGKEIDTQLGEVRDQIAADLQKQHRKERMQRRTSPDPSE